MMRRPLATRSVLLCGALFVAFAAAPAGAQESSNLTEQIITGLGLVPPAPPDIDYRERAPLVVPPTGDVLPPPRSAAAITENPAWPKDHDEQMRKKAQVQTAAEIKASSTRFGSTDYKPLTPSQLQRDTRSGTVQGSGYDYKNRNDDNLLSLSELGFFGWGNKQDEKPMVFEGEPERQALVQPPPGYQTPAPNAAYGVVSERQEDTMWRMPTLFDRTQKNK